MPNRLPKYGDVSGLIGVNVAASTAVTNTTDETAFDKTVTVESDTLDVGRVLKIRVQGIATATNSTDTLNVKLYLGSTEIAATGAVDVANNDIFTIDAHVVCRTSGSSGTYVVTGDMSIGASGTVTRKALYKASTSVDTTADITVSVKATWSAASASDSCRLDVLMVECL